MAVAMRWRRCLSGRKELALRPRPSIRETSQPAAWCVLAILGVGGWAHAGETSTPSDQTCRQRYEAGLALAQRGDCALAVPTFQAAIALCPAMAEAHHDLARCDDDLGKSAEAIVEMRQAAVLAPQWTSYVRDLGVLYAKQGEWSAAIEQVNHLWDLDQGMAFALAHSIVAIRTMPSMTEDQQGSIYGRKIDDPAVRDLLDEASRRMQSSDLAGARQVAERAVAIGPGEPLASYLLANILGRLHESELAIRALEDGLSRHPRDALLLHALGWGYYGLHRPRESVATWERLEAVDEVAYQTCDKLIRRLRSGAEGLADQSRPDP